MAAEAALGSNVRGAIRSGYGRRVMACTGRPRRFFFAHQWGFLLDTNIAGFVAEAAASAGTIGSVLLRPMQDCSRYGTAEVVGGRVKSFREKIAGFGPGLINAGVYLFSDGVTKFLQPQCSLEKDVLPSLCATGLLAGHVYGGYFLDIGIPEDFARATENLVPRFLRPAVFLGGDGVLNHDTGPVGRRERSHWSPGAQNAVRLFNEAGYHVFVVINQAGVARGPYPQADLCALHRRILLELRLYGATIDDLRFWPYSPGGCGEVLPEGFRLAGTGMLLDLIRVWQLRPEASLMIGHKGSDMEAAEKAGVTGYLFPGGNLAEFADAVLARTGYRAQTTIEP